MTYDQWKRRPVYIVQVFTFQMMAAVGTQAAWFRCVPCHRDEIAQTARNLVASRLIEMRRAGLTRQQVKAQAVRVIESPFSYGGVLQQQRRDEFVKWARDTFPFVAAQAA